MIQVARTGLRGITSEGDEIDTMARSSCGPYRAMANTRSQRTGP